MNVPQLRFDGFDGEWEKVELGRLMNFKNGLNYLKSDRGHNVSTVGVKNFDQKRLKSSKHLEMVNLSSLPNEEYLVIKDDLLFVRSNGNKDLVGRMIHVAEEIANTYFSGFVIRGRIKDKESLYPVYMLYSEGKIKEQLKTLAGGTNISNLSQSILNSISINLPQFEEQKKLADFLSILDRKIEKQQEKIEKLEQFKKGMMRKIFSQELRFKDEDGGEFPEWEERALNTFTKRLVRKNKGIQSTRPLTISAQQGLVDQKEFFNKNVASANTEGYYLLKKGEFAYNKSYSNGYPWGAIKRLNNYENGILSTLYICFEPLTNVDSDFLSIYFESTFWYKEISLISGEGARNHGLLNIGINDFFGTRHKLPSIEEQRKIASTLMQLNKKIEKEKEKLIVLDEQKYGFMQEILV